MYRHTFTPCKPLLIIGVCLLLAGLAGCGPSDAAYLTLTNPSTNTQSVSLTFSDGINWLGENSTAPTSPDVGDAYYSTTNNTSWVWNGVSWDTLAESGADGAAGAAGPAGPQGPAGTGLTYPNNANVYLDGTANWTAPTATVNITTSTATNLTGIITGNGSNIGSTPDNSAIWNAANATANTALALATTANTTANNALASANVTVTPTAGLVPAADANKTVDSWITRIVHITVIADNATLTTTATHTFTLDDTFNGWNLVDAQAAVCTVSSSGTPTFTVTNTTDSVSMLTVNITIDASEYSSYTATTARTIDTTHDDVATGDRITVACSVAGTGTKGMEIILKFRKP